MATLAVSSAAVFIVLSGIDPAGLALWRLGVTALIFGPVALPRLRRELSALTRGERWALLVSGVTYGLHFVFFNTGFERTSYESTVVLLAAQPLFAAVLGFGLLRERIHPLIGVSLALGTAGLVIFVWEDYSIEASHLVGDFIVLACGLSIVVSYTFGRRLRQKLTLSTYVFSLYAVGAGTSLVYLLLSGQRLFNAAGLQGWAALAVLVIVATVFGHTLFNHLVKYVQVIYINLVILIEPVIAVGLKLLFARYFDVFEKNELTVYQVLGALLLFAGVAIGLTTRGKGGVPRPSESS